MVKIKLTDSSSKTENPIHKRTEQRIKDNTLVCAASIVGKDGKTIWYEQQGYSDYENKKELKPYSMFRLASMTKPVTAVAAMLQAEKGKINLYDNISRFLPQFEKMQIGILNEKNEIVSTKPAENKIRIIDLLTHTSGLGQGAVGDIEFAKIYPRQGDKLSDTVPKFGEILLDFEPQTQTGYSPLLAFDTLAYIIEQTSGLYFEEFLKKYIFEPLAIQDITFTPTNEQKTRLVKMYAIDGNHIELADMKGCNFGDLPNSYTSGGASLLGTIEDYYRFTQMLVNFGELDGVRILSQSSVRQLQTPMLRDDLPGLGYGVNWALAMRVITQKDGYGYPLNVGSYGWSGAYGTHFWVDPSLKMTAIYFTNLTTAGGAGAETAREFEMDVMRSAL